MFTYNEKANLASCQKGHNTWREINASKEVTYSWFMTDLELTLSFRIFLKKNQNNQNQTKLSTQKTVWMKFFPYLQFSHPPVLYSRFLDILEKYEYFWALCFLLHYIFGVFFCYSCCLGFLLGDRTFLFGWLLILFFCFGVVQVSCLLVFVATIYSNDITVSLTLNL